MTDLWRQRGHSKWRMSAESRKSDADLIEAALKQARVALIPENGGGAGVRLRDPEKTSTDE